MFNIYDNDSAFAKHLKNEANQSIEFYKDKGEKNKIESIEIATDLLIRLSMFGSNYNFTKPVINSMTNFVKTGLFSPLTLQEGEFIYIKPGLSINRRFNRICNSVDGIFDNEGYIINTIEYYDVIKNINTIDDYICDCDKEINNKPNRIYLSTGGVITDIYFDTCFIKQLDINKHSYIPKNTIAINTCKVMCDDVYINVINATDNGFKFLNNMYALNFQRNNNTDVLCFGLIPNIKINELRSERCTI